jgi:molecular chaperone DnaK
VASSEIIFGSLCGHLFDERLTRSELQALTAPMLKAIQRRLKEVLLGTQSLPKDVKHLLMVCGSSRIPAVIAVVERCMRPLRPTAELSSDHATAQGAALFGSVCLNRSILPGLAKINIAAVTPMGIGIGQSDGPGSQILRNIMARRNLSPIKCYTGKGDRTEFMVNVFEGD